MKELTLLTPVILVAGVIVGIVNCKRNAGMQWVLFAYLALELLLELTSRYFGTTGNKNNLIFLSVAGLIDVAFYTVFYQFFLFGKRRPWLALLSGTIFLLLCYMGLNKSVDATVFNSYDKVISNTLVVLYAVVSSFDLITGEGPIRREVMRMNAVILLFYALDILVALTLNFLVNAGMQYVIYFFVLRVLFLQLLYFIFGFTLWQTGKNRKR